MILDIVGAGASWTDNKLHVAFDVVPVERYHLDLKTGEIFKAAVTPRTSRDNVISAMPFVTSRREHKAAGAEPPRGLLYFPGRGEPDSKLHLIWQLPDDHLAAFHALVLAGRTPRQAIVSFPHGAFEFGWEPDGSGQKWDNEKSPAVPIEMVDFLFDLQVPSGDHSWNTEVPEDYDREFFSNAAKVNFVLIRKLSSIESSLGRLSWTVGLIALLMLGLALSRFWH